MLAVPAKTTVSTPPPLVTVSDRARQNLPPDLNVAGVVHLGVPMADTAHMTNGVSALMVVYGEAGDDTFEVNHNAAKLFLDFTVSKEIQQMMVDQFGRRSVRKDVGSPAGLPGRSGPRHLP